MKILEKYVLSVDIWIYTVMGLIFLLGIFLCLLPIRRVQKSLKKAVRDIGLRRPDGSYMYTSSDFLGCRALDDCWKRFLSNLDLMRKNNSVCEIDDFINPLTAIHEPGHSAFGEMIPGVLTTLGILGSFYGIVKGLSSLDLTTSKTMSQSITVLIAGMGTAFYTSIAGAVLAVVFQLLRRMTVGSAERTLKIFVTTCQTEITALLTSDAALMQTLHAILVELRSINSRQAQSETMEHDIGGRYAKKV